MTPICKQAVEAEAKEHLRQERENYEHYRSKFEELSIKELELEQERDKLQFLVTELIDYIDLMRTDCSQAERIDMANRARALKPDNLPRFVKLEEVKTLIYSAHTWLEACLKQAVWDADQRQAGEEVCKELQHLLGDVPSQSEKEGG